MRFETGEPATGPEIVAALEHLSREGERFLLDLPLDAFSTPQGGKWSPADHARHLAKSTFPLGRALGIPRFVLGVLFGRAAAPSRSFVEMRETYRERLARGATAGRFTPEPVSVPANRKAWRAVVLGRFHDATSALCRRIETWDEASLDRFRLPHPLLGKLTVREMLLFTVYHDSHHLNAVASRLA